VIVYSLRALVADVVAGRPMARPLEWRLWDASGHWRQVETIAADLRADPSVGQIVLTTRDVGARKTLEQQLTQVTLHDLLTNLPNRAQFHDRLGQALASGKRAGRPTTVLFLGSTASGASTRVSGLPPAIGCSRSARGGSKPRFGRPTRAPA
jgi:hypothetical protein